MKALFLTRGMPPPFLGGSGIYYYNIFRRFPAREVTIFTEQSRAPASTQRDTGMRFVRRAYIHPNLPSYVRFPRLLSVRGLSDLDNLLMMAPWSIELVSLCLMEKPDVVFVGQLFPVGLLGVLARNLLNVPFMVFVHGEELLTAKHYGGYRWRLCSQVLRKAYRVIANSSFTRHQLIEAGVHQNHIEVITPMVDTEIFHPNYDTGDLRKKLSIQNAKVLLSVGRLTRRKGHSRVISILNRLLPVVKDLRYIIVGTDVGEEPRLRRMIAELGLEKHVIFVGRVTADELPKYYCLCDLMILPNYELSNRDTEGFGMVFLEASACGKPVVGGRAGGTEDAVVHGETGLPLDAKDDDALINTLIRLLTDPRYARTLGRNGRRRVLRSFHWGRAAAGVRDLALQAIRDSKKSH